MRTIRRLAWAAAFAALTGGSAFAQQQGGTAGGATGGGTTGGGGGQGGGFGGGLGNQNQSGAGGTQLLTPQTAPNITAPSQNTANTNTAISPSNVFGATYANPYYQGRAGATVDQAPGGFGAPLYTNTGAAGGGRTTTGATGQGGRAGGGFGTNSSQDPGGVLVPLPRQISYSSQIQFKSPPIVQGALFTDIRGTLDRSTFLSNPRGVDVTVAEGNVVVLRGQAADPDEARAIEGMVRLTPGVRDVRNELTVPRQP